MTPSFVVGATLPVLGVFLVSVFAQFVTATDVAMIGVAIPDGGQSEAHRTGRRRVAWVEVLQKVSEPRVPEGPNNWNDGA